MDVTDLLIRARSVLGKKTIYKLGGGGMFPTSDKPSNIHNECDCSGYVCWCFGISRKTDHPLYKKFNGGWINTDAMVNDAKKSTGFFELLEFPNVGCIVVYPSGAGVQIGHVGIVTEVIDNKVSKVIHCSSGNFKKHKDAILETDPSAFKKSSTIFAWYDGLD